jgi:hypothetical protein
MTGRLSCGLLVEEVCIWKRSDTPVGLRAGGVPVSPFTVDLIAAWVPFLPRRTGRTWRFAVIVGSSSNHVARIGQKFRVIRLNFLVSKLLGDFVVAKPDR